MAFDPDAFLAERTPDTNTDEAAPTSYTLPFDEADFKAKRKRAAQFDNYIDLFAKDHPDLPDLADLTRAALMRESGGNANAVSSTGALGLMQMMPDTFAAEGGQGDPMNVVENIDKGMGYLADQYRKFGTPELALAAYNAGPGNVRKHKGIPPFPETKAYVNAAMGYFQAIRKGATPAEAEDVAKESDPGFDPDAFLAQTQQDPIMQASVAARDKLISGYNQPAVIPTERVPGLDEALAQAKNSKTGPQEPYGATPDFSTMPGVSGPKSDEVKAFEELGQNYLDEKKRYLAQHPMAMFTPEKAAATAGGKEDKRSFLGRTLGDILGSARNVTTLVAAPLAGKSYEQRMGERYAETAANLEQEPILKEAQRKMDAGEALTPEENAALAAHPGFLKSMGQFINESVKHPVETAKALGVQAVEDLPAMLLGQFGVEGALAVTGKLAAGWKASRSVAYAEKLMKAKAEARLAKPSVVKEIAKDAAVNAAQAPAIGYAETKASGGQYGGAEALRDVATSLPFTFMGAPTKIIRAIKDPRPSLSELRAHPAINEMMPRLQHLLQNPETSDIGFLVKPKDDGTTFWSREDLDKAGYTDREPGEYGAAGAYDPKTGQVTLQKTADASTVIEESIHHIQERIRQKAAENATSPEGQNGFYTDLQKKIGEWEDAVRAEAKRRGVTLPEGDELLGQAMTAHMGYADAYEGTIIPRVVVPDAILDGFNKILGNADELRGANPVGEGDIAAASALPEPVRPSTADAMEHAITVEDKRRASGLKSEARQAKMRREMIDLTPTEKKAPIGSDDQFAGVEDMVAKAPSADPADAILAALQEHNGTKPAEPAPMPETKPAKGRKAKKRVPEEDLVISQQALEEKQARDQARLAANGPQPKPDEPATLDLPARKPVPGTEGQSNFNPNEAPKESPEVSRILNNAARRPLPDLSSKSEENVQVWHLGDRVKEALAQRGNGKVLHVHPEDMKRLGLYRGPKGMEERISSMAMRRQLGMPVKIDPSAPRLTEIAHSLMENMQAERAGGKHLVFADATAPENLEFHHDDLADALINRPRRKEDVERLIKDAQGRYASNEDAQLAAHQAYAESKYGKEGAPPEDKGYPAEWDDIAPVARDDDKLAYQLKKTSAKRIAAKYEKDGASVNVSEDDNGINLSKIVVPKEKRGQGTGTKFMEELIAHADNAGKRITLSPSADFGGSVPRLKEFYKRFGFVENKGRGKDFTTRETMYRDPTPRPASEAGLPAGKENDPQAIQAAAKAWKEKGTDSPFFKRWFGKSKVVDEKGKPLRVFHGTTETNIEAFLPRGGREDGNRDLEYFRKTKAKNDSFGYMNFRSGSFFSPHPEYAGNYTRENTGTMYPAYIKAENPIYMDQRTGKVTGTDPKKTPDALILHDGGKINEVAVIDPTQVKSTFNRGTFDAKNPDIRYQLVGRKAKGFDQAERRGETFPGKYDGKARFEIDDSRAKWTKQADFRLDENPEHITDTREASGNLGQLIDHPKLFKNYPDLKNIRVSIHVDPSESSPRGHLARHTINDGGEETVSSYIQLRANSKANAREMLMHEIQHAIQYEEGFAKGGNWQTGLSQEDKAKLAQGTTDDEYNAIAAKGRKAYRNLAGEIEARDTQSRSTKPYATRRKNWKLAQKILAQNRELTTTFDHQNKEWEGSPEQKKVIKGNRTLETLGFGPEMTGHEWRALRAGDVEGFSPAPYSSEKIPVEDAGVRYQLRARKPAESPATPEAPKQDQPKTAKTIPFPSKAKPAEGAFIPHATGDMDTPAGAAPRVDERVSNLREAEASLGTPPKSLSRDVARTWASMDEDVRDELMTHNFEHYLGLRRQLSDVEAQAFDAIVQGKREAMEEAQAKLQATTGPGKAAAEAESMAATAEYVAGQMAQINGLTETARALAAAARRMKGAKSTDASALVKTLAKAIPDIGQQDLALLIHLWKTAPEQFPDALRGYANPGKMRKLGEFYRAGLLSWVPTHIRNVAGNAAEDATRLAETPLAGALDAIAQAAFGGKRTRYAGETTAELTGMAKAFPSALSNLGTALKSLYRDEPITLNRPLEYQTGAIGSGKAGRVEKAVGKYYTRPIFKLLSVEDRFFRDVGGMADVHRLTLRKAIGEGKSGKAAATRAEAIRKEMESGQHPEILREVSALNDERVFQEDPGQFIRTLSAWSHKTPLGFFLPFVKTPANLAKRTLQRTPFGFLRTTREFRAWRKAVADSEPESVIAQHRGAAMDLGARTMVGSTILSGFAALAATGTIGMTGGGPNDPKEKRLKMESGWQPYSFRFRAGGQDHWVPYAWWEPVSSLLGMAADLAESKTDKGFDYENAVQGIAGNLISKSYLQSLLDLAGVINSVRYGEEGGVGKFASSVAGSWIPAFIGRAAQGMDPTLRDVTPTDKGMKGIGERIENTVKSKVPGWSESLPPVYGSTGEPVQRKGTTAERWLAPGAISSESDAAPLVQGLEDAGVKPPALPTKITVEGPDGASVKVDLLPSERAQLAKAQAEVSKMLTERVKTPFWKAMDIKERADEIDQEYKDAHDEVMDQIRAAAEERARQ